MDGVIRRDLFIETAEKFVYCKLSDSIRPEKLLEIKRIHVHCCHAADRDGQGLLQGYSKKRAACYVGEPSVFHKKFHKGEQMVVCLNLVNEHEGRSLVSHFLSGECAQRKVEVFSCFRFRKQPLTLPVFFHIDFNEVGKQSASDLPDDERLSDLPCAIDYEHLVTAGF